MQVRKQDSAMELSFSGEETGTATKILRKAMASAVGGRKGCKSVAQYDLGDVLGFGSAGRVHVATDKATGKKWACKVVTEEVEMEAQLQEVELLLQLDHPNIVQYREHFFSDSGLLHIVMELVAGTDLMTALRLRGSFAEEDAREVVAQLLDALEHVHDKGIAHRDLKPENILVHADDHTRIKIIDFGLGGQLRGDDDGFQEACGTPGYVAPEVVRGEYAYDTSCDIWSVGVVLFLLLSGDFPFKGDTLPTLLAAVRKGVVSFRDPAWEMVSMSGRETVKALLTINPQERPTAAEARRNTRWLGVGP